MTRRCRCARCAQNLAAAAHAHTAAQPAGCLVAEAVVLMIHCLLLLVLLLLCKLWLVAGSTSGPLYYHHHHYHLQLP